jgi:hypothetical protein
MSGTEVVVVVGAMLLVVAFWLDGNAKRRDNQTLLILRGLQRQTWDGTYDTCPICGIMRPCFAHTDAGAEPGTAPHP